MGKPTKSARDQIIIAPTVYNLEGKKHYRQTVQNNDMATGSRAASKSGL